MATQTVEFRAATGLTITAKLFAAGSDTEVASVSATEATNRKGTYAGAFTDVASGEYMLLALSSGSPVASWWVTLTLTTATFQVYDRGNAPTAAQNASQVRTELTTELGRIDATVSSRLASASYSAAPTAASIADAVWDEATSGHQTAGTTGKALTDAATVTVTPLSAGDIQRVVGTEIQVFQGEAIEHTVSSITDADGNAVTLTGKTLEVVIDRVVDLRTGTHEDLEVLTATVESADSISFTNTTASTATVGNVFRWSCREPSNGNYVWARGVWNVLSAATKDT